MKKGSLLTAADSKRGRSRTFFFVMVLLGIFLDQSTKLIITNFFFFGETLPVIDGFFNLTYIRNPGISFGMLPAKSGWLHWVLLAAPLFVSLLLFSWYRRLRVDQRKEGFAISLITAGALSNCIDRFRLSSVVDFLDFHWKNRVHYPAFNVADILICTGVATLFWASFKNSTEKKSLHYV